MDKTTAYDFGKIIMLVARRPEPEQLIPNPAEEVTRPLCIPSRGKRLTSGSARLVDGCRGPETPEEWKWYVEANNMVILE